MNTLLDIAKQAGLKGRDETALSPQELAFAQGVVRECANICVNENHSMVDVGLLSEGTASEIQYASTVSCGEELAKLLKRRFEVE